MLLTDLLKELPRARLLGPAGVRVDAVSQDSRLVRPGAVFVAVPGFKTDGHRFLRQAVAAGASAIAVQADHEAQWAAIAGEAALPVLVLEDARAALPRIAAAVYGHPARRLRVIGVTGTDGKTSFAHLMCHVLTAAGEKAGLISTAECRIGAALLPDTGRFTTPEAPQVQAMLSQMVQAGCRWAVVEATSHGLALHRVDECEYDIAVLTNLGLDHIDFHGTPQDYSAAKGRLFQMLDESVDKGLPKTAVLNADDPAHAYFGGLTSARRVTYAVERDADVRGDDLVTAGWSTRFHLLTAAGSARVRLPRPGDFNVYNALAAAAAGLAAGLDLPSITAALESWPGAPGRMQLVDAGQPFTVVVDFAHAPDSLRRVLGLLRQLSRGRLVAVFGCIGERDKDRRLAMGRVAAQMADYTIVTDDNPYSEDRDVILREIAAGLRAGGRREGHDFAVVPDRREAIAQALAMAVDEDVVLLAGKGHEIEVHLADGPYPCDDAEVARRVLRDLQRGA
ncbi:MAG: UDP-N-acetylmuramoyl-L-alanyl-D-glutamate--2,6-diaminopimelate ligase [Dehalococcoidia bacterium]|nr:UDP-N-acetylmuramoyl-L-alanyl-D-glutamate--2,6-diaminopimelate ligase [Dehalococcoidia bacterium]